jgi:hypothetical protein
MRSARHGDDFYAAIERDEVWGALVKAWGMREVRIGRST